jgi:hypothetical protein
MQKYKGTASALVEVPFTTSFTTITFVVIYSVFGLFKLRERFSKYH